MIILIPFFPTACVGNGRPPDGFIGLHLLCEAASKEFSDNTNVLPIHKYCIGIRHPTLSAVPSIVEGANGLVLTISTSNL